MRKKSISEKIMVVVAVITLISMIGLTVAGY